MPLPSPPGEDQESRRVPDLLPNPRPVAIGPLRLGEVVNSIVQRLAVCKKKPDLECAKDPS